MRFRIKQEMVEKITNLTALLAIAFVVIAILIKLIGS